MCSSDLVPFKGAGPAKQAVLGAQLPILVDTLGTSLAEHKAGKLKILAIAMPKRSEAAPDTAAAAVVHTTPSIAGVMIGGEWVTEPPP